MFSGEHKLVSGQSLIGATLSALSDEIRRLKFTINAQFLISLMACFSGLIGNESYLARLAAMAFVVFKAGI